MDSTNTIASILRVLGFVTIIAGIVIGLIIADGNHWILALPYWIGGFISGMCMLGFSEIINILHKINLKLNR